MLKRIDVSGILLLGGFVLSGLALRYRWTETTLLLAGTLVVGVLTYVERRLARKKI
jgi:hypothetical protein